MQNLRDKLLKAGLVSSQQAEKATQNKPAPRNAEPPSARSAPPSRSGPPSRAAPPQKRTSERPNEPSRIPRLPPLALPGTKAYQRIESLKQHERDKKLRDLATSTQVAIEPGEHAFHFVTRKGKLRRLELSEAQARLLEEGKLAVVERPEPASIEHSLVPPDTALKMMGIWEKSVRFFNKDGKPIGFLSDEELKEREASEARGELSPEEKAEQAEEAQAAVAAAENAESPATPENP